MLADEILTGCDVNAVNLVLRDETLHPLYFGAEIAENVAGFLRDSLKLSRGKGTGAGYLAFNNKPGHG
jgi:hypothetical protein